nr:immunoglobulin-associated J chain [Callorhinchus milii]
MMSHCLLGALVAVLLYATFVTASSPTTTVLIDSKCKCLKVTSREVNHHGAKELARDIEIVVPMRSREKITDPHSGPRTKFVYQISDFLENCVGGPKTLKEGDDANEPMCNPAPPPADTCYGYDSNIHINMSPPTVRPRSVRHDFMSDAP